MSGHILSGNLYLKDHRYTIKSYFNIKPHPFMSICRATFKMISVCPLPTVSCLAKMGRRTA